jgi:hypothetical protein
MEHKTNLVLIMEHKTLMSIEPAKISTAKAPIFTHCNYHFIL